jgi:iron(II)-dependent oxidoreductase
MDAKTPKTQGTAEELIDALVDARKVELELLEGIPDSQMLGTKAHFVEPPIWEFGHVGWFQEYWILRQLDGDETLLPGSDGIYDSFHVSYKVRWDHAFPSRRETRAYIGEVLKRSLGRLDSRQPTEREQYFYRLQAPDPINRGPRLRQPAGRSRLRGARREDSWRHLFAWCHTR